MSSKTRSHDLVGRFREGNSRIYPIASTVNIAESQTTETRSLPTEAKYGQVWGRRPRESGKRVQTNEEGYMENKIYDEYPASLVFLCVSVNILIYIIGAFIVSSLNVYALLLYILYCLWMEARLLLKSCRYCYYFGKRCAFGKGKVCSWFFGKKSENRHNKKISFYDLIPDFLVSLIPLAAGVYAIVRSFSWFILGLIIALLILAFPFTGYIRGSIACKFCKQKENGCGAIQLFEKNERRS